MKLKPQITWVPLVAYTYTAIQTLVINASKLKDASYSDSILIYGTLMAVLWLERECIKAIWEGEERGKNNILFGVILFLISILIIFIGRQITSLIIDLWGLFLLASAIIILFAPAKYINSAVFVAFSGSVIVLLGRLVPAFMSSDMAVAIAGMSAKLLNYIIPPVISRGVSVYFGQYAVEVVSACSGMNSMFSLLALSVIYIRQESARKMWHIITLIALVIPVAMLTNLLRVIILILITAYGGERMSQGIFHDITGVLSFIIALVILGVTDIVLGALEGRKNEKSRVVK